LSEAKCDSDTITHCIEDVNTRITALIEGLGGEKPIDARHEILYRSPRGYTMFRGGPEARYHLFSKGMRAYIMLKAEHKGKFDYSIGRMSEAIPFPVLELCDRYNEIEGRARSDGWNGSSLVAGHRGFMSTLEPRMIAAVTDEYLESRP
jgi:hypothetical protein